MRDIGKNIKQLRIRKKLTQDELAEKLFVTRQTVSNYENGKSKPDIDMLVKISEIFNTDVQQLIYGPEPTAADHQKRRLLVGAGLTAAFLTIYLLIRPIAAAWQDDYMVSLNAFNNVIFLPLALMAAGWTVGQLAGMALQREPLRFAWARYAGALLALILVILLGLNILCFGSVTVNDWLYMHELRGEWVETEVTNTLTGETYTSLNYHHLPVPLPEWLQLFGWNYLVLFIYRHILVFVLAGAALWLLGFPKRKIN